MDFKFGVLLVFSAYLCSSQALPPCTCTRNYQPVCGSDGETYSNQCLLDCVKYSSHQDIVAVREGPCEGTLQSPLDCVCPYNYLPVCGTDGETYPNECSLDCKRQRTAGLEMKHAGPCVEPTTEPLACACTREMKPVCGSDGNTYSNDCLLNCATARDNMLSIAKYGPCEDKVQVVEPNTDGFLCSCTREKKPVCGSDGNTYSNDCLLNCATARDSTLSIAKYGPCEDKVQVVEPNTDGFPCSCTREKKPVCGSDGNTYSNDCLLNCATARDSTLSIAKYGPCEDKVQVVELTTEGLACSCTREKKPVCGSDGNTYSNDCLLNCATARDSTLSIASYGPCGGTVEVVDGIKFY